MDTENQAIKLKIQNIDWILIGTILESRKQCGKANCKCMSNSKYLHGPYYIWTRKENGTTKTKTLTKKQVVYAKKAFKNMKIIVQLIGKWKKASLLNINRI